MSFYLESKLGSRVVHHENGTILGELVMGDDGFFAWWPPKDMQGCLPEHAMRYLTDALVALNFGHNEAVNTFFREEKKSNP